MARRFVLVVDGIPEEYSEKAIKATLNLGLRKVMGSRIARMALSKDMIAVLQNLEIKHLAETNVDLSKEETCLPTKT